MTPAPRTKTASARWRRALLLLAAAAVLATRFLARQKSVWEWDDAIFLQALRRFDPQTYIPQAPFYPGFVYLARGLRLLTGSGLSALTLSSALGSGAAVFFVGGIAWELLGDLSAAAAAALLFAFFPQVWIHAGIPLSDDAGLAAALGAAWLALASRRRPKLLLPAAAALSAAAAIRPQTALVAAAPFLLALKAAGGKARAGALAALGAGVALLYVAPIAAAGSLSRAAGTFAWQVRYVLHTDSLAAHRRDFAASIWRFGLDSWGWRKLGAAAVAAAIAGAVLLLRRRRAAVLGILGAAFLPYALLCVVVLDPTVAGRYSLPYLPAVAILAAVALRAAERRFVRSLPAATAALLLWCGFHAYPAVRRIGGEDAPPAAAASAIRRLAGRPPMTVVYSLSLRPQAAVLFPGAKLVGARQIGDVAPEVFASGNVFRFGLPPGIGESKAAVWPSTPAFTKVTRGRYLAVPYGLASRVAFRFGAGWYPSEVRSTGPASSETFRWMGPRAELLLPPLPSPARLALRFEAPLDAFPSPPVLRVSLNGREVARGAFLHPRSLFPVILRAPALSSDSPNDVSLEVSETFVPSRQGGADARKLGLALLDARLN